MDSTYIYYLKKKSVSGRDNWRKVTRDIFMQKRDESFNQFSPENVKIKQFGFETPRLIGKMRADGPLI